jgi:hypothetical protein
MNLFCYSDYGAKIRVCTNVTELSNIILYIIITYYV